MSNEKSLNSDPELIDYASGAFRKNYQLNGMRLYVFFAPEMYYDFGSGGPEENGLDCTAKYVIFLLHPTGQYIFRMFHSDGFWKIDDDTTNISGTLGEDMIQWLSDQIDSKTA